MRELQEEVSRLRGIREEEEEIDSYFLSLQGCTTKEDAPQDEPSTAKWQTVTSRARAARDMATPVPTVRLENRYEALVTLERRRKERRKPLEGRPLHALNRLKEAN